MLCWKCVLKYQLSIDYRRMSPVIDDLTQVGGWVEKQEVSPFVETNV